MQVEAHRTKGITLLLVGGLALFALATLAYGAWFGFPVQDDTYMIRFLRMGGPDRVAQEHPDRPVFGFLLAACTRIAGEHRAVYIAIGLLGWSLFAAQASRLWTLLFPQWSSAWPAVGLAVMAPVVTCVQFSTVTTLIPCVLPVMLVLAGLLPLLGADAGASCWPGPRFLVPAFLLPAAAALVSEYGLAAAAGAAALLFLLGRWRPAVPMIAGASVGYAVFHATAQLSFRLETNPALQAEGLLSRPWTRPFRVVSAAWNCVIGAWGRAASEATVEWSSKTTLLAAGMGVVVAAILVALWARPREEAPEGVTARRLVALGGAVIAGLYPAIAIMGWPLRVVFETRFLLPALPFASCATVGLLLFFIRPKWAAAALCAVGFLAADRLVLQAVEERKMQEALDRLGRRLQPYVGEEKGLVVLVTRDRTRQSKEEVMAKATYRWSVDQALRFVIVRPEDALFRFGPRSGCRSVESLRLRHENIRWPRANEPIRRVLWDQGDWNDLDPEPYYRGCPSP